MPASSGAQAEVADSTAGGASPDDRVVFVVGSPRSGSTMLARMIGSHSQIYGRPEPHLLTPLAHLGYYANVEKAPYDHILAAESVQQFVDDLPGGEDDYVDACRAYSDTLYRRMLATKPGKDLFLDKTPANSLIFDFMAKVYPTAKYIVLTRHPLAIFSSFAESFFDSDYQAAHDYNPILSRYVPALAKALRTREVPIYHVVYEELVAEPERILAEIFEFLGVPPEGDAVEYGKHAQVEKGLGDPIGVAKHSRPSTDSIHKWAAEIAGTPSRLALCQSMIAELDPADLEIWGHPLESLWDPLSKADPNQRAPKKPLFDRYRLERKAIVTLRRRVAASPFLQKILRTLRLGADVLLRS